MNLTERQKKLLQEALLHYTGYIRNQQYTMEQNGTMTDKRKKKIETVLTEYSYIFDLLQ